MSDIPDYGEPWRLVNHTRINDEQYTVMLDRTGRETDEWDRAVDCVNACRGQDPQAMRMKALAWDLLFPTHYQESPHSIIQEIYYVAGWWYHSIGLDKSDLYDTREEAIIRLAIKQGRSIGGSPLKESDL